MTQAIGPIELFGHAVAVTVDDSPAAAVLASELALYPGAERPPDRFVALTHAPPPTRGMPNPTSHLELSDGFVARYPTASVRFGLSDLDAIRVTLHLPVEPSGLRRARRRWRNIQFATPDESVGQLFHELAAVPMLSWDADRMPIHASAVELPTTGLVLVGGTGGGGKTTLAMELCRRHGGRFAADDISVVDAAGLVHPNLAYPKIYGYNLGPEDPELEALVFAGSDAVDRAQWRWRMRRAGPSGVRRRISPQRLAGDVTTTPTPLRGYLLLVREPRDDVAIEPIDAEAAAAMSIDVLAAEIAEHHRHLAWHAFNARAAGAAPTVTVDARLAGWRELLTRVLAGVDCRIVRIPTGLDARALRAELAPRIAAGLG
jgi:hypothetical protein